MLVFYSCLVLVSFLVAGAIKLPSNVEFMGRFSFANETQRADWSGSGIKLYLVAEKDTITVDLSFNNCAGSCKFYILSQVNCVETNRFEITPDSSSLQLVLSPVTVGEAYEVSLTKITEVSCVDANGIMELGDLSVDGSSVLTKEDFKKVAKSTCTGDLSMLVFGDSVSVAYGVDGTYPCTYSAKTQNVLDGYAALVAQEIGAHLHVVGWSGKGVVRNYGDSSQTSVNPLPTLYNRTLGSLSASGDETNTNYWTPTLYQPDVVLVLLGSNDYSTQPNPTDEQFITGLVNFLNALKSEYPTAKIAAMCSPSAHGPQCANIETSTQTAGGVGYLFLDPSLYNGGYGCDMHPNTVSQQNMANVVTPFVQSLLGL